MSQNRFFSVSAKAHEANLRQRSKRLQEAEKEMKKAEKNTPPSFLPNEVLDRLAKLHDLDRAADPILRKATGRNPKKDAVLLARAIAEMIETGKAASLPDLRNYDWMRAILRENGIKPGKITRRLNRALRKLNAPQPK